MLHFLGNYNFHFFAIFWMNLYQTFFYLVKKKRLGESIFKIHKTTLTNYNKLFVIKTLYYKKFISIFLLYALKNFICFITKVKAIYYFNVNSIHLIGGKCCINIFLTSVKYLLSIQLK